MTNIVPIQNKRQATRFLEQHPHLVNQNDIRDTVHRSLQKLNDVESRIDEIESRGFFKRMVGGITGKNQRDMVAAMRDIAQAQQLTIQLVLSLAIMHSQNQQALNGILDELTESKGIYTRITDHIDFLYDQVELIKISNQNSNNKSKRTLSFIIKFGSAFLGAAAISGVIYFFVK